MVRKYKPYVESVENLSYGEYITSYNAAMEESEHGTYVKLETYLDETKRLRAMIHRLEEQLNDTSKDLSKDSGYIE
jgi:hypothetical protein